MNKTAMLIIATLAIGLFVLPSVFGAQENDYRAWVTWMGAFQPIPGETGGNVTTILMVTYVPITPSPTYTLTAGVVINGVILDLSKPATIQTSIAEAVREFGANGTYLEKRLNYSVVKVYVPDYTVVVP